MTNQIFHQLRTAFGRQMFGDFQALDEVKPPVEIKRLCQVQAAVLVLIDVQCFGSSRLPVNPDEVAGAGFLPAAKPCASRTADVQHAMNWPPGFHEFDNRSCGRITGSARVVMEGFSIDIIAAVRHVLNSSISAGSRDV